MLNANKTAGIQFGQQKELCEIMLNGQVINWRTSVKHLGNVDNSLSDKSYCRAKRAAFIGSANRCIGNYNYHKDCTKRKLWQAYCSSFCGSPLWLCKSNGFNEGCTAWGKAARRFFILPYHTHNYLIGPLSGQSSIHETLYIRTLKFIRSMLASANPLIAYIGYMTKSAAASQMGQNIAFIRHTFGVMLDDCMSDNLRCIRNYFEFSETEAANVSVASELQAMSATSYGFTNDEICVMLEAVCIE